MGARAGRGVGLGAWVLVLALVASSGCVDERDPQVICLNANCREPSPPSDDDWLVALALSLQMTDGERPLIDGVQLDTFWHGPAELCLFARDLKRPSYAPNAWQAAELIVEHLGDRAQMNLPLTRSGSKFSVFVELEGHVGEAETDAHTPEQRRLHAACAVDVAQRLIGGARRNDYVQEIVFTAFDPRLLRAVRDAPGFDELAGPNAQIKVGLLRGLPEPLGRRTDSLASVDGELGLDLVSTHPDWMSRAELNSYAARDLELGLWVYDLVPETLDAIEDHQPSYVTTSEARTLHGWLESR